jgi:hypothetical protein
VVEFIRTECSGYIHDGQGTAGMTGTRGENVSNHNGLHLMGGHVKFS